MKSNEELIESLKQEYFDLMEKIAKERFALVAYPLNSRESSMLSDQVAHMNNYARVLLNRIDEEAQK
ncbi:crAss001_48 related protein [Listeria kieliensis]